MKKQDIINILQNKGYKVVKSLQTGTWIATKGYQSYKAESLNALYRLMFK